MMCSCAVLPFLVFYNQLELAHCGNAPLALPWRDFFFLYNMRSSTSRMMRTMMRAAMQQPLQRSSFLRAT